MTIQDDSGRPAQRSHVFILRLWLEDLGSGQTDWRGKVQYVNNGEARYFRDWPTLEAFMESLMNKGEPGEMPTNEAEETRCTSQ
jgi:hypothetical protein